MSSANPCKLTPCLAKMDTISSMYEMNCLGPKTEPWGELTVSVEDPDGYQFTFSKAKS